MTHSLTQQLKSLQSSIAAHSFLIDPTQQSEYAFMGVRGTRLYFTESEGGYSIVFYGDGNDDDPTQPASEWEEDDSCAYGFPALLDLLSDPAVAAQIIELCFIGGDVGANGLAEWDFTRLVAAAPQFTKLQHFSVRLTDPGDHNISIVDHRISADGTLATQLLHLMPQLKTLSLPSAPNADFFKLPNANLNRLRIQDPWPAMSQFIDNFGKSSGLPALVYFDYQDFANPYGCLDRAPDPQVNFAAYEALLRSPAFDPVKVFTLRTPALDEVALVNLQGLRPSLQLLHVPTAASRYVSHLKSCLESRG